MTEPLGPSKGFGSYTLPSNAREHFTRTLPDTLHLYRCEEQEGAVAALRSGKLTSRACLPCTPTHARVRRHRGSVHTPSVPSDRQG